MDGGNFIYMYYTFYSTPEKKLAVSYGSSIIEGGLIGVYFTRKVAGMV